MSYFNTLPTIILLALILALPTTSCGQRVNLPGLEDAAKDLASEWSSKQIAKTFGFDPVQSVSRSNRKLTRSQKKRSKQAHQLFDASTSRLSGSPPSIYGTGSTAENRAILSQAAALTRFYPTLSDAELIRINAAYRPILNLILYEQLKAEQPEHVVIVPPGSRKKTSFMGYCLDKGVAAPATGEGFQLRPVKDLLIDEDAEPIYHQLLRYGQKSGDQKSTQGLMWRLVHGIKPVAEPVPLSDHEITILDKAIPGGAAMFEQYLHTKHTQSKFGLKALYQIHGRELVQKAFDQHVNRGTNINIDLSRLDLRDPVDIEAHLQRMMQTAPSGTEQAHASYSFLDDNVVVRAASTNGLREMEVEIVNLSDEFYLYDPTRYMGMSTRITQPIGHYPQSSPNPDSDPNALNDAIEQLLDLFEQNPDRIDCADGDIGTLITNYRSFTDNAPLEAQLLLFMARATGPIMAYWEAFTSFMCDDVAPAPPVTISLPDEPVVTAGEGNPDPGGEDEAKRIALLARTARAISRQKQERHIKGDVKHTKGGYLSTVGDAQDILDAVHSGRAKYLGEQHPGHPEVRDRGGVFYFEGVTGVHVSTLQDIKHQETNIFWVKGEKNVSIVPVENNWKPRK